MVQTYVPTDIDQEEIEDQQQLNRTAEVYTNNQIRKKRIFQKTFMKLFKTKK